MHLSQTATHKTSAWLQDKELTCSIGIMNGNTMTFSVKSLYTTPQIKNFLLINFHRDMGIITYVLPPPIHTHTNPN